MYAPGTEIKDTRIIFWCACIDAMYVRKLTGTYACLQMRCDEARGERARTAGFF